MWTPITRRQHSREHLRYGSDLADAEWAIIAVLLPAVGTPVGRGGGPCAISSTPFSMCCAQVACGAWYRTACTALDGLLLVHPATG